MKRTVKEAAAQNELSKIISILLSLGDKKLLAMKPILENLTELGCDPDEPKKGEDDEHWRYTIENIARAIEMIGRGEMSYRLLASLVEEHRSLIHAAQYLPKWLQNSQAVWGSLALIRRARRLRSYDLAGAAIVWCEKLGEPIGNESIGELEKISFLSRVAFRSGIDMAKPALYKQFFGQIPGLRGFASPVEERLFRRACEKWLLEDIFALCPLPTWGADHSGKKFWLEKYNWQEQKNELLRLQRQYPGVTVRFATMPELMFLDLSWRLVTGGESPMGIGSFRCEHPAGNGKCLKYGGVDEHGAKVETDKYPNSEHHPVLPLFILKAEG
ncbi:MAG: hypothetical protein ABIB72_02425 [Candidatus Falkowbacteria bacterium]